MMRSGDWNNSTTNNQFIVDVKIKSLTFTNVHFKSVLRIGWLGPEFSMHSNWKKTNLDGPGGCSQLGWKSSLCQRVTPEQAQEITLVVYQKVGENQIPIGIRTLPCAQCFGSGRKHKFQFSLEKCVPPLQGQLLGWVRAKPSAVQDNRSYASVRGSRDISRSRSWQMARSVPDMSMTESVSVSTANNSVDMSIDLHAEVPTKFCSMITMQEVYTNILRKHTHVFSQPTSALRFLLELPGDIDEFYLPEDRQWPPIKDTDDDTTEGGFLEIYMELGLLLKASRGHNKNRELCSWTINQQVCDLPALQDAIQSLIANEA